MNQRCSPQRTFLFLALVFGLAWVFLTPPFQVCDEKVHYYRAAELSIGQVMPGPLARQGGGYVPEGLDETFVELGSEDMLGAAWVKQDFSRLLNSFKIKGSRNYALKRYENATHAYFPLMYLPQTMGVVAANLFSPPPIISFYVARVFNLLFWVLLVYTAIGLTPLFKWGMTALALVPMSLFQAASASPDAFVNGVSFLWFSVIYRYAFADDAANLKTRDILVVVCLSTLVTVFKGGVYFPLVLLLLLVPPEKFGGTRQKAHVLALAAVCCVAAVLGWMYVSRDILPVSHVKDNIAYFIESPWDHIMSFAKVLFRKLFVREEYMPGVLGWMDTPLPRYIRYMSAATVIALFLTDPGGRHGAMDYGKKLIIAAAVLCSISTFLAVVYVSYPQSPHSFWGMQGRYFIPFGMGLFTLFYHQRSARWLADTLDDNGRLFLISVIATILLVASVALYQRYYA